jgi:hypothetical protein
MAFFIACATSSKSCLSHRICSSTSSSVVRLGQSCHGTPGFGTTVSTARTDAIIEFCYAHSPRKKPRPARMRGTPARVAVQDRGIMRKVNRRLLACLPLCSRDLTCESAKPSRRLSLSGRARSLERRWQQRNVPDTDQMMVQDIISRFKNICSDLTRRGQLANFSNGPGARWKLAPTEPELDEHRIKPPVRVRPGLGALRLPAQPFCVVVLLARTG